MMVWCGIDFDPVHCPVEGVVAGFVVTAYRRSCISPDIGSFVQREAELGGLRVVHYGSRVGSIRNGKYSSLRAIANLTGLHLSCHGAFFLGLYRSSFPLSGSV